MEESFWNQSLSIQGRLWLGAICFVVIIIFFLKSYFSSDSSLERKNNKERREHELKLQAQERIKLVKEAEKRRKVEQQEMLKQRQKIKDEEHQKYSALRKQIEQMPIYERWKQDVIKKCGSKCQMCGSNKNLEVHHRISFYLILIQNNVTSTEKAFECRQLWDTDNGEVLCKECHDKMESSINRETLMAKNYQLSN